MKVTASRKHKKLLIACGDNIGIFDPSGLSKPNNCFFQVGTVNYHCASPSPYEKDNAFARFWRAGFQSHLPCEREKYKYAGAHNVVDIEIDVFNKSSFRNGTVIAFKSRLFDIRCCKNERFTYLGPKYKIIFADSEFYFSSNWCEDIPRFLKAIIKKKIIGK
ncbi:MAG: hypothetical protein LBC18_15270 [Opitutaceae bacterium]|jgi:hypothetical protein|nr:hypothetical protein [Opitutaceae bacterium]